MRDRLILTGLGVIMIVAAGLIFSLSRVDAPPTLTSAQIDGHDHAVELLPPAPVGRTLFGGNSGELREAPGTTTRATPASRAGTPMASVNFDVFAPARFQATPAPDTATP